MVVKKRVQETFQKMAKTNFNATLQENTVRLLTEKRGQSQQDIRKKTLSEF